MIDWKQSHQQARLEEILPEGIVRCHLSPRQCTIKEGKFGFCKVRGNVDGRLVTYNYGKGVHITEETIETEACFHFAPGSPILSLGNIGCMFNCSYCQNWKTSQAKYVDNKDVYEYTPQEVVDRALRHGIKILSWTYNDPVVWHEFVRDTSRLAKEAGLINLYKSAFYITPEAVEELLPSIDIFSISLKAIDDEYYRRMTTGRLQPVLDATKMVYDAGKHVEVSMLMITDISDSEDHARRMAHWVLENLDSRVPLHFVRFHPDYKLRDTVRTPLDRLKRAREVALEMGMEHVYLGNVYDPSKTNTFCNKCEKLLVSRYGLNAQPVGLDDKGCCADCGHDHHFKFPKLNEGKKTVDSIPVEAMDTGNFEWRGDVCSLHVMVRNPTDKPSTVYFRKKVRNQAPRPWNFAELAPGESYRFILSKDADDDLGPEVAMPHALDSDFHEVFDRAHFPTLSFQEGHTDSDVSPLPHYQGNQVNPEQFKSALSMPN